MKKLLMIVICSIMVLSGCSKPENETNYGSMEFEDLYQTLIKKDVLYSHEDTIELSYTTKELDVWISARINLFEEIEDKIAEIFFTYSNKATDVSEAGTVYLSNPINPAVSDELAEVIEDAKNQMSIFLDETWNMSDERFREFLVYVDQNHGMDQNERASMLALQKEILLDQEKVTTAICVYESENGSDHITMISNNDFTINALSWETLFNEKNQDVLDYLNKEKESYKDILGATYTIEESDNSIKKRIELVFNMINEKDLKDIGLISGEGTYPVGVSLETSIAGFEEDGYTCNTTRE